MALNMLGYNYRFVQTKKDIRKACHSFKLGVKENVCLFFSPHLKNPIFILFKEHGKLQPSWRDSFESWPAEPWRASLQQFFAGRVLF